MDISILFVLIVGGFLLSFINIITYIKALKNKQKATDLVILILGILFGGPAMLFSYLFVEIRDEDMIHKYRYLVLSITYTIIEIILIVLLFYFNLIKLN